VGDRERRMYHAQPFCNLGGTPVKLDCGPSTRFADHFDLQPADPKADSRPKGLGACLLGRKARRKAFGGIAFSQAVGLFGSGKNTVKEAIAIAVHGLLNSPDLCQIDSGADDHAVYQAT